MDFDYLCRRVMMMMMISCCTPSMAHRTRCSRCASAIPGFGWSVLCCRMLSLYCKIKNDAEFDGGFLLVCMFFWIFLKILLKTLESWLKNLVWILWKFEFLFYIFLVESDNEIEVSRMVKRRLRIEVTKFVFWRVRENFFVSDFF